MDGLQINEKIRFGYAKAAEKLGQPFQLYRASTPLDPLQSGNLIGTLNAVMSQDWTWMKANKPGNAIWFCCVDGQASSLPLSAEESDFLVGDHTFYVLTKEYQLPITVMECNRTISIVSPDETLGPGYQSQYAGYLPGTSETLVTSMPASVLIEGSSGLAETKLPTDTQVPMWKIHIPNIGGVVIRTGDIITDDENQDYVIINPEETEFGWRIKAKQVVNSF